MQGQQDGPQPSDVVLDYATPAKRSLPNVAAMIGLAYALMALACLFIPLIPRLDVHGVRTDDLILSASGAVLAGLAIRFGMVGRRRARRPGVRGARRSVAAIVLGITGLAVAGLFAVKAWDIWRKGDVYVQLKCANHLRSIGSDCLWYAQDHAGRFPDQMEQLYLDADLHPEVFLCEAGIRNHAHTPAKGASSDQTAALLTLPQHNSYIYVGAGLTTSSPPDSVVAYDRPDNHGTEGINVLYADGTVRWLPGRRAKAFLATARPPPPPATTRAAR